MHKADSQGDNYPMKGPRMVIDPKSLQIGQTIVVKELHYGVLLNPPGEGEAGLTVVEMGHDHLLLDDAANGSTRRIPLYLIHKSAPVHIEIPEVAA